MQIINPATEEIITEIEVDTKEILLKKYERLKSHQLSWYRLSLAERTGRLKKFSELLGQNIEHLAFILTSEVGKPLQQSRNEIKGAQARIEWLTDNAEKYLADEQMTSEAG